MTSSHTIVRKEKDKKDAEPRLMRLRLLVGETRLVRPYDMWYFKRHDESEAEKTKRQRKRKTEKEREKERKKRVRRKTRDLAAKGPERFSLFTFFFIIYFYCSSRGDFSLFLISMFGYY